MTRRFLFLQGPVSPFFPSLAATLAARGHAVHRINLCLGDWLLWRGWLWPWKAWKALAPTYVPAEDFRGRMAEWPAHIAEYLTRHAITDLVLLGEQRPYHRIAIDAAKARGVTVTAVDYGYLRPDWIIIERDGHNAASHYPRDPAAILALAEGAPPIQENQLYRDSFVDQAHWDVEYHLSNLLPGSFRHYRSPQLHAAIPAFLGTGLRLLRRSRTERHGQRLIAGLPEAAPLFLFAMQMENDFSIRAYSPYPDMDTPLREVVESFAAHAPADANLVVKVHPLDPGLKLWGMRLARMAQKAGIASRVHLVDVVALDPLIARATGMLTVNSTSGFRALQMGKPVLALGEALYKVEGLAHLRGLDSFWRDPPPPDRVLVDAFLRGIARHLHVRGVFYKAEGLAAGVAAAAAKLEEGLPDLSACACRGRAPIGENSSGG